MKVPTICHFGGAMISTEMQFEINLVHAKILKN